MPVFGTMAARFNDDGVTALYQELRDQLGDGLEVAEGQAAGGDGAALLQVRAIVPAQRVRYLAEIAETVRAVPRHTERVQAEAARERQRCRRGAICWEGCRQADRSGVDALLSTGRTACSTRWRASCSTCGRSSRPTRRRVRGEDPRQGDPHPLVTESLSGTHIRKVALPRYADDGELLRFLRRENLPGSFPFTAGVFPFKREGEDPTRMFAGEGDPFRTNRRFKLLSEKGSPRSACPPPSTRSRSTAATPTERPTSTARSATPASRSPPSTT
jgi:methylmalonyl-CoA mutase